MLLKPTKILWPTDFSELSLKAAGYARTFRESFGADLHIVHVCQVLTAPEVMAWSAGVRPVSVCEATEAIAAREIEEVRCAATRLQGLVRNHFGGDKKITCRVLKGLTWQTICDYARDNSIDLIILATHGLTGMRHILIGSTAERIVRYAHCPVLTVKAVEKDFVSHSPSSDASAALLCGQGI